MLFMLSIRLEELVTKTDEIKPDLFTNSYYSFFFWLFAGRSGHGRDGCSLIVIFFIYSVLSPALCQPPLDGTLLLLGKYHCLKLPAIPEKQSESFVLDL